MKAFKGLQDCLCHAPVSAMPELGAPYEVVCDASDGFEECEIDKVLRTWF